MRPSRSIIRTLHLSRPSSAPRTVHALWTFWVDLSDSPRTSIACAICSRFRAWVGQAFRTCIVRATRTIAISSICGHAHLRCVGIARIFRCSDMAFSSRASTPHICCYGSCAMSVVKFFQRVPYELQRRVTRLCPITTSAIASPSSLQPRGVR